MDKLALNITWPVAVIICVIVIAFFVAGIVEMIVVSKNQCKTCANYKPNDNVPTETTTNV